MRKNTMITRDENYEEIVGTVLVILLAMSIGPWICAGIINMIEPVPGCAPDCEIIPALINMVAALAGPVFSLCSIPIGAYLVILDIGVIRVIGGLAIVNGLAGLFYWWRVFEPWWFGSG